MEFEHEYTVPLGIDDAFAVLVDLERVAPCLPGATLEEVEGDTYSGRVKVKVGPMSLTYHGTATVADRDPDAHTARIEAAGREKRGAGTAAAHVRARLVEHDGETRVHLHTDIDVTGKPAQFGRGVMADVGSRIIDRFATNLREMLEEEQAAPPQVATAPEATEATEETEQVHGAASAPGPRRLTPHAPREEALDLVDVAGEATAKRLVPVLAVVLLVLFVVWRRRRRDA